MAKESMKAREVKRAKLVAKYAAKRAALKEIVNKSGDPVEAYEAARKLQKIPRNANPIRLHNRCKITGRPKGYIRLFWSFSYSVPRNGIKRSYPRRKESKLVNLFIFLNIVGVVPIN